MNKHPFFKLLLLVTGLAASAQAIDHPSAHVWDRDSAMAAVHSVDIDLAVFEIGDISTLADGDITVHRLLEIETRSDWPIPAREAAIYQFTRSLAGLPRDAVAEEIMQHLYVYQALTLVPHEDHAGAAVPLFNIRAAATGVLNGWQRTDAALEAGRLLGQSPGALVSAYLRSGTDNVRAGFLDTLRYAGMEDIHAVQTVALEQLRDAPELTRLVGMTVEISGDTEAARELLMHGNGAGLARVLEAIGKRIPVSETAGLLDFAIHSAPASNASLAISAWWPLAQSDAGTRQLMLDTLADPALGSAAALALARDPDIQTIKALQDSAAGDSLTARRARLALDINRDLLSGKSQP